MPCGLVGRYVTILADYSLIPTPYEIALCQFGVLGNRIVIPDEEVIEPEVEPETEAVPPTFADILQASPVVRDQASSWVLP